MEIENNESNTLKLNVGEIKKENPKSIKDMLKKDIVDLLCKEGIELLIAEKATLLSGNNNLTDAKKWIEDHKLDSDFKEPL